MISPGLEMRAPGRATRRVRGGWCRGLERRGCEVYIPHSRCGREGALVAARGSAGRVGLRRGLCGIENRESLRPLSQDLLAGRRCARGSILVFPSRGRGGA